VAAPGAPPSPSEKPTGTAEHTLPGPPLGGFPSEAATHALRPGQPAARTNADAPSGALERTADFADVDLIVPIVEESLEVGTRKVGTGGVRVITSVVTTPVDEKVCLREERVQVERHATDRPLSKEEADTELGDHRFEVRAKAETPIVDKRTHVVEEVVLKKQVSERTHHVGDSLRHTEADVTRVDRADPKPKGPER
jgi:uncharacterized protein (TIGR02271 family)